ncbi:MAG: MTH1187 family thiamine-binding protein [Planctomycetota bacterium]
MLAEISIVPVGEGEHLAELLKDAIDEVRRSGLTYQVTAMGTLVEGDADEVWALLRRCHQAARRQRGRVLTELRLDDAGDAVPPRLARSVEHVSELLGQPLRTSAQAPRST